MSQETGTMLMTYQMEHPSDANIQQVKPDHVPVKVYWKLRREYEKNRRKNQQRQKACQPLNAMNPAKLNVIRESPEQGKGYGRNLPETTCPDRNNCTEAVKSVDCGKGLPCLLPQLSENPVVGDSGNDDVVRLRDRVHNMADVKKFLKQSIKENNDRIGCVAPEREPNNEGADCGKERLQFGAGDDREMAVIYRDFTKTLQRAREQNKCYDVRSVYSVHR